MTNLANMNLEINEDVIKTIFEQTLNQSIIAAMGNKEEYMSALINSVLSEKVDSNGKVSSYSRENKFTFVDVQVRNAIRAAANEAVQEYIEENKRLLKQIVKSEMGKEENKSALVNAFVKGAMDAFDYDYTFRADLKIERNEY